MICLLNNNIFIGTFLSRKYLAQNKETKEELQPYMRLELTNASFKKLFSL